MFTGIHHVFLLIIPILTCEYKAPSEEDVTYAITEYPEGHRPKRESRSWDWMRIETEYDPTFNILDEEKKEVLEDMITSARDYFESILKVQRLGSIQLRPACIGDGTVHLNNTYQCSVDCEKRCGGAVASVDTPYFAHCSCKYGPCPSMQRNWGGKLRNADFVLFVSVKEQSCGPLTLAFATHCAVDQHTQRPIAGHVNICLSAFKGMKAHEVSLWEATIKHELIHAFVFSPSLFPMFKGAGEVIKGSLIDIIPGVIQRYTRFDWDTSKGMISHDVYMIVTPKVRQEARDHFRCPDLEGAEIESQGGSGTAGSHWEKRVFENEAMTGVSTQVYALTRLTFALFEDSGWYKVNYDKAEQMLWGKDLGCDFAKKSCLTWMKANRENPYPFCNVMDDSRCSANRLSKVRCNLVESMEGVPDEYDYNIPNLYKNRKGKAVTGYGQVEAGDFCPYYRTYGGVSREDSDTRCTFPDNMNYNNYSLEVFSPTARCFYLEDGIKVKSERGTVKWMHSVGCYETVCKDNRLHIKTQNSKFYPCYQGGQLIHVEKRVHGVGTVTAKIVCPSCTELCGRQYCAPDKNFKARIGDPTREAIRSHAKFIIIMFLVVPILHSS